MKVTIMKIIINDYKETVRVFMCELKNIYIIISQSNKINVN